MLPQGALQCPKGLWDRWRFGAAVLALPDNTGNGTAELVVTAPYEDPSGDPFKDIGRAYIIRQQHAPKNSLAFPGGPW